MCTESGNIVEVTLNGNAANVLPTPHLPQHFEAVLLGQDQVEDHQVRGFLLDAAEARFAVVGVLHAIPRLDKRAGELLLEQGASSMMSTVFGWSGDAGVPAGRGMGRGRLGVAQKLGQETGGDPKASNEIPSIYIYKHTNPASPVHAKPRWQLHIPKPAVLRGLTGIAQSDESSAPVQHSNDRPFRSSPLKKVRYVITWYPTNCFWSGWNRASS